MGDMQDTVLHLAREISQRLYGKYRGNVQDNEDPKKLGRLRLTVPSLFGSETTTWALPCLPFGGHTQQGMFFIPEIDSQVWVEFEEGDANRPIWTGVFWTKADDLPDDAAKKKPTTRTIQTPSGHKLQFDDADGERRIKLSHPTESELIFEESGSIKMTNSEGMSLKLDNQRQEILLEDGKGNHIQMDDSGWTAQDTSGNHFEMAQGIITISANSAVTVDAPSVSLAGQAGEPLIKGLSFLTKYMTHTHTVAPIVGGPTSPPIPQGEMDSLSTKVTTG